MRDPDWNPLARIGDIASNISQELDKAKALVSEVSAKAELGARSREQVLKSGKLSVVAIRNSFVAKFQPKSITVEINGHSIPARPNQIRGVGRDQYEAIINLAAELKKAKTLG